MALNLSPSFKSDGKQNCLVLLDTTISNLTSWDCRLGMRYLGDKELPKVAPHP